MTKYIKDTNTNIFDIRNNGFKPEKKQFFKKLLFFWFEPIISNIKSTMRSHSYKEFITITFIYWYHGFWEESSSFVFDRKRIQ